MSKFMYKLQPLLNVKVQMEDSLKNELGKATRKLECEKEILREIELENEERIKEVTGESSKGITAGKLKEYGMYISFLKEKAEYQKENINYARTVADNYRGQLIKVVQEKKMLEKLKDKRHTEFIKEQLGKEQAVNDEIISFNYNKR